MKVPWDIVITIVCTLFASSGFWTFLMNRQTKDSAERRMILGLGYRSICELCEFYIKRGYISREEYEDLKKYLFSPYSELGGNGTCEKLMKEVDKLPLKKED